MTATSAIANPKWKVTQAGSRSVCTTMPPSTACMRTRGTAATDNRRIVRCARCRRHASIAIHAIRTTRRNATNRCEYSIQDLAVGYGSQRSGPHFGQLVQPSPDSVARTSPPTPNRRTVVEAVAIESFWKRVIEEEVGLRGNDSSRLDGASSCDTHGVTEDPSVEPAVVSAALDHARRRVDPVIERFLADRRAELAGMGSGSAVLVDELRRLIGAGGKRIRPALCLWAHRAGGGADPMPVVKAGAALELLHTFALVHDDVMDRTDERRGVPASHVRFAKEAPVGADPDAYGTAVAILVGDLAAVLSEQLIRTSGAEPGPLAVALGRFDRMRVEMAAGQFLDVSATAGPAPARVAALKTGSYTAEGPVLIGAALAEAGPSAEGPLRVYGRLIGEAFQLRDDVIDGDADPGSAMRVGDLVDRGIAAIEGAPLEAEGVTALVEIAELLRLGTAGRT